MSEKPLANVVICCTSVTQEERSVIIRQAVEMGAISQADLTSDVTHLIAAQLQTEKYRFAARHRTDLKLMSVGWISAIHNIWVSGRDVNLSLSETKYKLPVFHGFRISVTNLDTAKRSEIEHLVTRNGGIFTGDMTKENTHLVAGAASGRKWEAVSAWQCDICLVGVEWVSESIKRGASLDEKYFGLHLAPSMRGFQSWFPPRVIAPLDEDDDCVVPKEKRKSIDAQNRNRKRLKKMSSTTGADGLWTEILVDKLPEESSLSLDVGPNPNDTNRALPDVPTRGNTAVDDLLLDRTPEQILPDELTVGIFQNYNFYMNGFTPRENRILRSTINSNGGTVIEEEIDDCIYITPQNGIVPAKQARSMLVTEYWLERCLTSHSFVDPKSHFTSIPFSAELPVQRMKQISICISGYSGIDALHIEKLCKMAGAIFSDTLTKDRSILLASSRECRKYQAAKEKGTRVVKVEWLWECIRRSKMIGISEYAIDGIEGSACRIDGQLIRDQRLTQVLNGKKIFVCVALANEQTRLEKLVQYMGAVLATSEDDPTLTHVIGDTTAGTLKHDYAKSTAFLVSPEWLEDTKAAIAIQSEAAYSIKSGLNDENMPPDVPESMAHLKLATEMTEIRRRLNTSAPVRRTSRKILGRVTSITSATGDPDCVMINTDISERSGNLDTDQSTQGVVYSDPDAAAERRKLLAKLDQQHNGGVDQVIDAERTKTSMRAVGLGESKERKLRNLQRRPE